MQTLNFHVIDPIALVVFLLVAWKEKSTQLLRTFPVAERTWPDSLVVKLDFSPPPVTYFSKVYNRRGICQVKWYMEENTEHIELGKWWYLHKWVQNPGIIKLSMFRMIDGFHLLALFFFFSPSPSIFLLWFSLGSKPGPTHCVMGSTVHTVYYQKVVTPLASGPRWTTKLPPCLCIQKRFRGDLKWC